MSEATAHSSAQPPVQVPNVEEVLLDELLDRVAAAMESQLRFVTMTCLDSGANFELYYHFASGSHLRHLHLVLPKGTEVPSISGIYFAAFLVENEIKELFGLPITGIALDYHGRLLLTEGGPERPMLKERPVEKRDV